MWQGTLPSLADRHGSASDGSVFFKTALRIGAFAKISIDLLSSIMPLYDIVKPKSYSPFLKCGIIKQVLWTFDITL